eukprot:722023-Pyramimonas_sp.AAC.1
MSDPIHSSFSEASLSRPAPPTRLSTCSCCPLWACSPGFALPQSSHVVLQQSRMSSQDRVRRSTCNDPKKIQEAISPYLTAPSFVDLSGAMGEAAVDRGGLEGQVELAAGVKKTCGTFLLGKTSSLYAIAQTVVDNLKYNQKKAMQYAEENNPKLRTLLSQYARFEISDKPPKWMTKLLEAAGSLQSK